MLISVFTPSNDFQRLPEVYKTLQAQTYPNWEWVVVPNGSLTQDQFREQLPSAASDNKVRIVDVVSGLTLDRVGALKLLACRAAQGDVLVELDHDDVLLPDALSQTAKTFEDPTVSFAFSNCANITESGTPYLFDVTYGWQYRPKQVPDFGEVFECVCPAPLPQHLSRIWFAPDHLRAWRRSFYEKIGGHDQRMRVGDDHDLMCRTYLNGGKMAHIDDLLYIHRILNGSTWGTRQQEIQEVQWQTYERYKEALALKWAKENGLHCLDLAGGIDKPEGYISVDIENGEVTCDLNQRWPFEDNSVGVLRASDAFEHFTDRIHTMNEAHRVLAHGGFLFSMTPSTDGPDGRAGRGAFCDPTHVSFWNQLSFRYYTQMAFRRYIEPRCTARFQEVRVRTFYPTEWHSTNAIPYVQGDLIALKDGPRFHGQQLI